MQFFSSLSLLGIGVKKVQVLRCGTKKPRGVFVFAGSLVAPEQKSSTADSPELFLKRQTVVHFPPGGRAHLRSRGGSSGWEIVIAWRTSRRPRGPNKQKKEKEKPIDFKITILICLYRPFQSRHYRDIRPISGMTATRVLGLLITNLGALVRGNHERSFLHYFLPEDVN